MMFNFHDFIYSGLMGAIGHLQDWQIILNAAGWKDKGVLSDVDLAAIQAAIEAQYVIPDETDEEPEEATPAPEQEPEPEEPTEEET